MCILTEFSMTAFAGVQVVEIVKRYDDLCLPNMSNDQRDALIRRQGDGSSNTSCTITITVGGMGNRG